MNMKKNLLYMLIAGIILSVSACKSSESAYRQAYEKAIQGDEQKETAVVEQPVPHVLEVQTPVPEESVPVAVREEKVTVVSGEETIKPYCVVCGSFALKANADALRQRLINDGYPAVVVINEVGRTYRVVCSSFATKEEAAKARDAFKARYPDNSDFQNAWILYNK